MIDWYCGNNISVMRGLPRKSFQACISSPPYFGLRRYSDNPAEIGREETPGEYVANLVSVFRGVRRVLRDDGVLFLNLGDSYASSGKISEPQSRSTTPTGCKQKDLLMIPATVAIALRADGWYLRSEICWNKVNGMPDSCRDRPTKMHEMIYMLTKKPNYTFYQDAVREPCVSKPGGACFGKIESSDAALAAGSQARRQTKEDRERYVEQGRNIRSVWAIPTESMPNTVVVTKWLHVTESEVFCLTSTPGAAVDGIRRKACRGCPQHGDFSGPASKEQCDGCEDVPRLCNQHNSTRRVSELLPDFGRTVECKGGSEGFPDKEGVAAPGKIVAISHSKQNRKRVRVRLTLECDNVCEETSTRIGDISPFSSESDAHENICARRILPDVMDARLWDQTKSYSVDKSSLPISKKCCCAYYRKTSEEASHFAPFPQALVQRCLLASTKPGDKVLDPFGGAGTVSMVAEKMGRDSTYIDLNETFLNLAKNRVLTDRTGGVHRRPKGPGFFTGK